VAMVNNASSDHRITAMVPIAVARMVAEDFILAR